MILTITSAGNVDLVKVLQHGEDTPRTRENWPRCRSINLSSSLKQADC